MKILTIPQKMSNSGSIHDIASQLEDRDIKFGKDCEYAVVLASFYGGKGYTTHRTDEAAATAANKQREFALKIIDAQGAEYDINPAGGLRKV